MPALVFFYFFICSIVNLSPTILSILDKKPLKCGYEDEWKRSAGLIKLLMRRINEDRQILNSIWQRKHRRIGYVLRHDGLLREINEAE